MRKKHEAYFQQIQDQPLANLFVKKYPINPLYEKQFVPIF